MKNPEYYSVHDAVRDVLQEMTPGSMYFGYHLCNKVRAVLRSHGSDSVPLDSTILRRVREMREQFYIATKIGQGKSEYTKKDPAFFSLEK
jgi:hypothetical protein